MPVITVRQHAGPLQAMSQDTFLRMASFCSADCLRSLAPTCTLATKALNHSITQRYWENLFWKDFGQHIPRFLLHQRRHTQWKSLYKTRCVLSSAATHSGQKRSLRVCRCVVPLTLSCAVFVSCCHCAVTLVFVSCCHCVVTLSCAVFAVRNFRWEREVLPNVRQRLKAARCRTDAQASEHRVWLWVGAAFALVLLCPALLSHWSTYVASCEPFRPSFV